VDISRPRLHAQLPPVAPAFLHPHRGPAKGAVVDAIDAAAVAFYQKFLEPPKVPATPLDKET